MADKRSLPDDEKEGTETVLIKKAKKQRNSQKYKDVYKDIWKCLGSSNKGETHVHCSTCNVDFTCAHGGRNYCKRHVVSTSHLQ